MAKRRARPWPGPERSRPKASTRRASARIDPIDETSRGRETQCHTLSGRAKRAYATRSLAKQAVKEIGDQWMKPYLCQCGYFHLGHERFGE